LLAFVRKWVRPVLPGLESLSPAEQAAATRRVSLRRPDRDRRIAFRLQAEVLETRIHPGETLQGLLLFFPLLAGSAADSAAAAPTPPVTDNQAPASTQQGQGAVDNTGLLHLDDPSPAATGGYGYVPAGNADVSSAAAASATAFTDGWQVDLFANPLGQADAGSGGSRAPSVAPVDVSGQAAGGGSGGGGQGGAGDPAGAGQATGAAVSNAVTAPDGGPVPSAPAQPASSPAPVNGPATQASVPAVVPVTSPNLALPAAATATVDTAAAHTALAGQLISFEVNRGQAGSEAAFVGRGNGYNLLLMPSGNAVVALTAQAADPNAPAPADATDVLHMNLVGANPAPVSSGLDQQAARTDYFIGSDPTHWYTDVANYGRVQYQDVYPGIDLVYYGNTQSQVEYDFVVHPGADPSAIGIAFQGQAGLALDAQGNVRVSTANASLSIPAPMIYQDGPNGRTPVSGGFTLSGSGQVGLALGSYDATRDLVIDPVLATSTYFGSSGYDAANGVTLDSQGNVYLVGAVRRNNTANQLTGAGDTGTGYAEAFVAKFSPDLKQLLYKAYLGGQQVFMQVNDTNGLAAFRGGTAIAVDAQGNAYITGATASNDFPVTAGAFQALATGRLDGFVAKLNAAGNGLVYSTYLGGTREDYERAIAVDAAGNAYVAGTTYSSDFPTRNPFRGKGSTSNQTTDGTVTELNPSGTDAVFSTFLGGVGIEVAGLALDAQNDLFLTGSTSDRFFPVITTGSYTSQITGQQQAAFVAEFNAAKQLLWGTYLDPSTPGSSATGLALAVDLGGNVYVAGVVSGGNSPWLSASPTPPAGGNDAFLTALNPRGSSLLWNRLLGGASDDQANAIAMAPDGTIWVAGQTNSNTFPTQGAQAPNDTYQNGPSDGFLAQFGPAGNSMFSTFVGGHGFDQVKGVALSLANSVYVAGVTTSADLPRRVGFTQTWQGDKDAFAALFVTPAGPPTITGVTPDTGASATDRITSSRNLTLQGTAQPGATVTVYQAGAQNALGSVVADSQSNWSLALPTVAAAGGTFSYTATATLFGLPSARCAPVRVTVDTTPPTVTLTVPPPGTDPRPAIRVQATDRNGLPNGTTVTLDVDLNNDGDFADPGETGYTTATLQNGQAAFSLPSDFSPAYYGLRARVTDLAGNEGTSATGTLQIMPEPQPWILNVAAPSWNAADGQSLLMFGNLQISHPLDLDKSPGTGQALDPALVYNSSAVNVRPILQGSIPTANNAPLPIAIYATLTWDNVVQPTQTFSTDGFRPGQELTFALQAPTATSGRHRWTVATRTVFADPQNYPDLTGNVSGTTFSVALDASPLGPGWSLGSVDQLIPVAADGTEPAGLLRVLGTGGWEFYAAASGGAYTSPADDNGTLAATASGYRYTIPDGESWDFNTLGQQTDWVSADGFTTVSYGYVDTNNDGSADALGSVTAADGATSQFTYTSGLLSSITCGTRTWTLTHGTAGDLTAIAAPDNSTRSFSYASHLLTGESWAGTSRSWGYTDGAVNTFSVGTDLASVLSPAVLVGLGQLTGGQAVASITDPLGNVTTWGLDNAGRPLWERDALGNTQQWTRDSAGRVSTFTDALGRTTSYQRDSAGYVTQETLPDGSTESYAYQTAFHALTSFTDPNGTTTDYEVDSGGHVTKTTDALGNVSTQVWVQGLLQSSTDARGVETAYDYDTQRRLTLVVADNTVPAGLPGDPSPLPTVTRYDTMGNITEVQDPLGLLTRYQPDGLGRVTATIEAATTPEARTSSATFDGAGRLVTAVSAAGVTTVNAYDVAGRVTAVQQSASGVPTRTTQTAYDDAGNATLVTDPLAHLTQMAYDPLNRVTLTTEAPGTDLERSYGTAYDPAGNITETTDPLGRITQTAYDSRDRATQVIEALGTSDQRTSGKGYDPAGNLTSVTDGLGNTIGYQYDPLSRLTQTNDSGRVTARALDGNGNVTAVSDPRGVVTAFDVDAQGRDVAIRQAADVPPGIAGPAQPIVTQQQFDLDGNLTKSVDALGTITRYGFDHLNRRTLVVDADTTGLARTATTGYDAGDRPTSVVTGQSSTNPQVVTLQTQYDGFGRPTKVIQSGGGLTRSSQSAYDPADNLTQSTDYLGAVTQASYDLLNRRTRLVEAAGTPQQRVSLAAYDIADNLTQSTDGRGVVTQLDYDNLNRATAVTETVGLPEQRVTRTGYDAANNVTRAVNGLGVATQSAYDAWNERTAVTDAAGTALARSTLVQYDPAGNVTATTDPTGATTRETIDALGRVVQVTDPAGNNTSNGYDSVDNLTSVTDMRGVETRMDYDLLHRRTRVRAAVSAPGNILNPFPNATTTLAYDSADNVLSVTDPLNQTSRYGYDGFNRRTSVSEGLNHTSSTAFDAGDHPTRVTDALGHQTATAYDLLGRATSVTEGVDQAAVPVGITQLYYDAAGNLVRQTDAAGADTAYGYDALGRRTLTIDSRGGLTALGYDAANNLVSVTDPDGNLTWTQFDVLNRRTLVVDPLDNVSAFYYDLADRLTYAIDRDQRQRVLSYDLLGRQTGEDWLDANNATYQFYTYGYDPAGNLTSASVWAAGTTSTLTRVLDARGQLASETDSLGVQRTYTVDAAGRTTQTVSSYPGGASDTLVSSYDAANRLTGRTLTTSAGAYSRTALGYDDANHLTSIADYNSATAATPQLLGTFAYDERGREQSQSWGLLTLGYEYDQASRLTRQVTQVFATAGESQAYLNTTFRTTFSVGYDNASQQTSLSTGDPSTSSTENYDADGNRTQDTVNGTATIGPNNQLLSDALYVYSYDAEGSLVKKQANGGSDYWACSYDLANRLVEAQHFPSADQPADITVGFGYDPLGRRVSRVQTTVQGGTTTTTEQHYTYDGTAVAADLNADNSVQTRYVRAADPDLLLARADKDTSGAQRALFYVTDRQDSVMGLTDNWGTAVKRIRYLGFGARVFYTNGIVDRFEYTGKEFDSTFNLQFSQARWYDPQQGRWLSQDPTGFAAGDANLYRYVGNSPTNGTDPTGRWALVDDAVAIVGGAAFGVAGQALSDLFTGHTSSWEEYVGAAVGGAVGAELSLYLTPIGGGIVGGAAGNATTQLLRMATGKQESFDTNTLLISACMGGLGGAAGMLGGKVLNAGMGKAFGVDLGQRAACNATVGQALKGYAAHAAAGAVSGLALDAATQGLSIAVGVQDKWESGRFWAAGVTGAAHAAFSYRMSQACFAAGTPLWWEGGFKAIELFRMGERVWARDEHDPEGPLALKVIEQVFVRLALVLHIHVGGKVIRTTGEHPFFAKSKGWVAAKELRSGDQLLCADDRWVEVEEMFDTGEWETVYNLRVADYHTYFVGDTSWGFAVWAHNTYTDPNTGQLATPGRNKQIAKEIELQLREMNFSPREARLLAKAGAIDEMVGQGLQNAINDGSLAAHQIATGGQGGFSYGIQRVLPEYDGVRTQGLLVTNEGNVVPFQNGPRDLAYRNYESAAHADGKAAIWIRENNSSGGVFYHNNTDGTCGYCAGQIPRFLPEGVTMGIVPPTNAVAPPTPNNWWKDRPIVRTGNNLDP
jgi:RHS repeat-associated protein